MCFNHAAPSWDVAIPPGLHVRINLQTGKREAKLLDEPDEINSENAIVAKVDPDLSLEGESAEKKKTLLSEALKNIQNERLHLKFSAEELSQIKREYKEKQDPSTLNDKKFDHFRLDAEVITFLIEDFLNLTHLESRNEIAAGEVIQRKINILDNFEHMLHQIDNSIHFALSHGGLDLLLPIVANESLALRLKAIRILGVLTQNNPIVQTKVFDKNFGIHLLKIMVSSANSEELSTTIFAFGSLIRKFPQAQESLLPSSGARALIAILLKKCELKVKVKVLNLITDLLAEHREMTSTIHQSADANLFDYYKNSKLEDWLKTNDYCNAVASIIIIDVLEFLKHPDLTEDYLTAIEISYNICRKRLVNNSDFKASLTTMMNHLMEKSNEYYQEVAEKISKIIELLNSPKHEEL